MRCWSLRLWTLAAGFRFRALFLAMAVSERPDTARVSFCIEYELHPRGVGVTCATPESE